MRYVALLRGINVGTSVQVPMKTLKGILERIGCSDVATYLNSGNAVFGSELGALELARLLERELEAEFGTRIPTLVKSAPEMRAIARAVPAEWKNDAEEQTYVAYLFGEADRPDLVDELPLKKEWMTIFHVPGALVWNIRRENYNRSRITKIASSRWYASMTTRNVNTARKLAELCGEARGGPV